MRAGGYITCFKCYISGRIAASISAIVMASCLSLTAYAEDAAVPAVAASAPPATSELGEESARSLLEELDEPRDYLSLEVVDFSTRIDHFFGDERYFQEHNKSVIQLETSELMEAAGNNTLTFDGQAKLDLPAAQRRFQLVLESNPEKRTTVDNKKNEQVITQSNVASSDKYAASLRIDKAPEESPWHFSADAGAKVQFPLDPFVRTRGSYSLPVYDWRFKLAETVFWFGTIGLGETTQFDLEHILSKPVLFRASTNATCYDEPKHCDLRQDLSVFHTLDERSALVYQLSVLGTNQPAYTETAYILLLRYRYRLHRDWIFLEATPQLNFPKTDDFKMNPALFLRLEMLFGAPQ